MPHVGVHGLEDVPGPGSARQGAAEHVHQNGEAVSLVPSHKLGRSPEKEETSPFSRGIGENGSGLGRVGHGFA